jgi:multidrug efflux pump subunit AcrA (membrane-fusion protein)
MIAARLGVVLGAVLAVASAAAAQETLSLATAQGLFPERISATGRIVPQVTARISARVSGHIVDWSRHDGRMLDVGMKLRKDQEIFQIDRTTFENNRLRAEAALRSAQANLENLTAPTRPERLVQLRQTLAELDARMVDRQRDEERFRRLVEQDKTMPPRRLEEVQTELAVLRAQRESAAARLEEAENGPTASEIAVADARVKEAQAALKAALDDLRDTTVRAPFDGLITRRMRGPGDYVTNAPATEVLELVSLDALEAELRLPESYFASMHEGATPVTLRSPLLSSELRTTVSRVIADIDPARGTFAVRVSIPAQQANGLAPGAFVSAQVHVGDQGQGVIVPQRAVSYDDDRPVIFVAENGRMQQRAVELGDRLTEGVVVRSGIRSGERVVVGPPGSLKADAPLPADLMAQN